jgi:hypothetical protein
MQSSEGGPSSIGGCTLGSLCDFTFHSTDSPYFCSYCPFYASRTLGTKVAEYFEGTLAFSGSAIWTGQSTLNVPLSISGVVAGFELLNCDQGANCTLGPQVFDLKIVGEGTGQFDIAETGLIMGVNANFRGHRNELLHSARTLFAPAHEFWPCGNLLGKEKIPQ